MCYLCSASDANMIEEALEDVKKALQDDSLEVAARNAKAQEALATLMAQGIDIGRRIERNIKNKVWNDESHHQTDNPR